MFVPYRFVGLVVIVVLMGNLVLAGIPSSIPKVSASPTDQPVWKLLSPSLSPPPREFTTMVYDSIHNNFILFGGLSWPTVFADTWAFNVASNTWNDLSSVLHPPARERHAMTFDSKRGRVILFGGWPSLYIAAFSDTWVFDTETNTWAQLTTVGAPSARAGHAMVYDPVNDIIILFGGFFPGNGIFLDTWVFNPNTNTWAQMFPSTSPPLREGHRMVYDPVNQKVIMFGGGWDGHRQGDTWIYDYPSNTWTLVPTVTAPSPRQNFGMVYDSANKVVRLFGGSTLTGSSNENWIFDPSTKAWTSLNLALSPSPRSSFGMAYSQSDSGSLLFDGSGETWFLLTPIAATIDFDPDTLNLKSKGKWVTVYIELPEGYDVNQIDVSSIRLNGTVSALVKPTEIGDYDGDGDYDLMVKFDRSSVMGLFAGKAIPGNYVIEVTGAVAGIRFRGTATIGVVS